MRPDHEVCDRPGVEGGLTEFPLSARQALIWLDHQLFPEARYHSVVTTVEVRGRIDVQRLSRAWQETVADLDALRLRIDPKKPVQRVVPPHPLELPVVALAEEHFERWIAERALRQLDERGPRWDAALLRASPEHHVFIFCFDHVVMDERSAALVVRHLDARYRRTALPSCVSFREYANAEDEYRSSSTAADDQLYWRRKLAGGAPPLRAYGIARTDRSVAVARAWRDGGTQRSHALAELARAEPFASEDADFSRAAVLATALGAYLYRVSGSRKVVIATPFANRKAPFQSTCGPLAEQMFIRVQVEENDTFETMARRACAGWREALSHGRACVGDRGLGHVSLSHIPALPETFAGYEAKVSLAPAVTLDGATGHGDLRDTVALQVLDVPAGPLRFALDLHAATFTASARERALDHFTRVLDALLENLSTRVDAVPLVGDDERSLALRYARGPDPEDEPADLVAQLALQVRRRASAIAVEATDHTLSYADLESLSNQLARRLRGLGVTRDSRVGVAVPRGAREIVTFLATLKAGGGYVPVDPSHPVERVRVILEDAAPEVLVAPTGSPLIAAMPAGTRLLPLDDVASAARGYDPSPLDEPVDPGQLAYILFTSGSTGRPKGVEIPRAAFANFLNSMARIPGLCEADRVLALTTTTFDIAGLELFLPIYVGGTTVIADKEVASDPRLLRARLELERFTVVQATPATWRLLVDAGWRGDQGLRMFIGGEALNPELAAKLLARGAELWNLYGPTETTVWSTVERITDPGHITIGRPIDRTQLYVLDEARQPVPLGAVGEIYIGGAGLARGYHGRHDLTVERFVPDPLGGPHRRMYRTGDVGRLLEDGRFECLGRADNQVKIRGFRIELGEVESVLRSVDGVKDAVVLAERQDSGDPRLVAYWVGDTERSALQDRARSKLPPYMLPGAYVQLPSFPLTTSGKVDRKALPRVDGTDALASQGRRPANDVEARLVAIWSDVLGLAEVGVTEDLFALGGTSVQAIQIRGRVEQEFGTELPLRALFENATIEAIAAQLGRVTSHDEPVVLPLRRGPASVPPLFCLMGVQLYQDLARAIPDDRPVIAIHVPIRVPAEGSGGVPIVEIARRYVDLILREQAGGPYHLAGLCFGGIIAFEVARQLEAMGHFVAVVAVLDGHLPAAARVDQVQRLRAFADKAIADPRAAFAALRQRLDRVLSRRAQRRRGRHAIDMIDMPIDGPWVDREMQRYEKELAPVHAHVLVVRAVNDAWPPWYHIAEDLGWSRFAARVSVEDITAGHLEIVRDPHVVRVANAVLAAAAAMQDVTSGGERRAVATS